MIKRILTLSIPALVITAALLYFFRLQTGSYLLTRFLQQAGAEDIRLELTALNSNKIIFSRADCSMDGTRLSMRHATFTWNPAALSRKQLDSIDIDTVTVTPGPKKQTSAKKTYSPGQIIGRIERIRRQLPFQRLSIGRLTLAGPAAGSLAGHEVRIRLENQGSKLSGELSLPERNLKLSITAQDIHRWNLTLNETGMDTPFFSARLHLQEDQLRAEIEGDLAEIGRINSPLPGSLPKMKGKLSATLDLSLIKEKTADLVVQLQQTSFAGITADRARLVLHGRMDLSGKLHAEDHSIIMISGLQKNKISIGGLSIGLDGVLERTNGHWQYATASGEQVTMQGINGPVVDIKSVAITPALRGTLSEKMITLNLQPAWQMRITGLQANGLSIPEAELRPKHPQTLTVSLNRTPAWAVNPGSWQLTTGTVTRQDISIDPDPISINIQQFTGTAERGRIKASLNSQQLRLTKKDIGLSLKNIRAGFSIDGERITGTSSFSPEAVPGTLAVRFLCNLKKKDAEVSINTQEPLLFSEATPLGGILNRWPFAGNLTGGQLHFSGSISRLQKQPVQVAMQAKLTKGEGYFKEIIFSGLTVKQDLQLLPTIQSRRNGSITIDTLETGITVKNMALETTFVPSPLGRLPKIIIRNLSASLFGGTVSDDFLSYDPQQPEVKSTIRLNNIDLARLVTVQQVKGLVVKGRVKGNLPFFFDRNGLRMDEGKLKNTGNGGLIQYTLANDNGLKESPLTGYALKALEEFHYSLLAATARYSPDGELQVSLHLEGKSPRLDTNRPVHLNINTEQNLLSLLKSLRYSSSLTDEIDREVEQHYKN